MLLPFKSSPIVLRVREILTALCTWLLQATKTTPRKTGKVVWFILIYYFKESIWLFKIYKHAEETD